MHEKVTLIAICEIGCQRCCLEIAMLSVWALGRAGSRATAYCEDEACGATRDQ